MSREKRDEKGQCGWSDWRKGSKMDSRMGLRGGGLGSRRVELRGGFCRSRGDQ